jgi:small subunit ribosomal protein S20
LAVTKSADKRNRQSKVRRIRNRVAKSEIRSAIKKLMSEVEAKNGDAANKEFISVQKLLDTAKSRGILHRNVVARKKSRLAKQIKSLA